MEHNDQVIIISNDNPKSLMALYESQLKLLLKEISQEASRLAKINPGNYEYYMDDIKEISERLNNNFAQIPIIYRMVKILSKSIKEVSIE